MKFRSHGPHNDSGAALLLAIGAVLMIGSIGAGLTAATTSSLNNRNTLAVVRNQQYAADGAVEQAITQVRLTPGCTAGGGSTVDSSMSGLAIRVDWLTDCSQTVKTSLGADYAQRNVVFSACLDTGLACTVANTVVTAQVNFEPAVGTVTKTFVQYWSVNR